MRAEGLVFVGLSAVAALVSAGAARGQSAAVLGPSNAAFVEGLWRLGYVEEADRIGRLVAASSLPDAEKKRVDEVHTRLLIAIKARSGDAMGRRDLVLKQLAARAEAMRAAPPASEAAATALNEWVEQHRLLADAVVEAIGQEQDPERVAELRKETDELFEATIRELATRKEDGERLRDEDEPGSELPMLVAFYGLGRVHYYRSLIQPAESPRSERYAEQALEILEDFDLEFSDSFAAFDAKLTVALCQQRLGKADEALSTCDDAIALRERFERGKDGVWQVDADAADVISAAVLQKALLLADRKDFAAIVELAKDYVATVANARAARHGLAILAKEAEAHLELGENDATSRLAQQLVDLDPRGVWGHRGRELLAQLIAGGGGKGVDAGKTLRLAESLATQGEFDQALRLCRDAHARAADEALQAEAMLMTGAIYATRGWLHEASVAFDAVVRRHPTTEFAPDALYRALRCFDELDESSQVRSYRRWFDERAKQLARDYPDHPRVPQLQLFEGERLERKRQFLAAARVYEAIASDSAIHFEARYRAANCNLQHSRELANGGQEQPARTFATKALEGFRAVLRDVEQGRLAATDDKVRSRLDQVEVGTRIALANLLLAGEPRVDDAAAVLAKLDVADDGPQAPAVWALRIRLRLAKDDFEGAAAALDEALAKAGDSRPLLATCRTLATALDSRSMAVAKAGDRFASVTLRRRAAGFYLRGANGAAASDVAIIADRLRVLGMLDSNVPEDVESWVALHNQNVTASPAWDGALQLYRQLADAGALDYKGRIGLARVLGYLKRWNECEAELATLFARESIAGAQGRLDSAALAKKPELLTAYLEWGHALLAATGGDQKGNRARATDVFQRIVSSVPEDSRPWWFARFGYIQSLYDRGVYEEADVSMRSLERHNPGFDGGRFHLDARLRALALAIAQKIPRRR